MRSPPTSFRFSFVLPCEAAPADRACAVRFGNAVHAEVTGPSREAVMNTTAQFLRSLGLPAQPRALFGILESPAGAPSGRDGWSIIVGADVAFSPTSIDPFLPPASSQ